MMAHRTLLEESAIQASFERFLRTYSKTMLFNNGKGPSMTPQNRHLVSLRRPSFRTMVLLLLVGMTFGTAAANAQNQQVSRSVIASGGVVGSSNGEMMVSATLGQSIIGPVADPFNILHQGFWFPLQLAASVEWGETGVAENAQFKLKNSPNPFAVATTISYWLDQASHVRLEIVDLAGRSITTLVDGAQAAGLHRADWNGAARTGDLVAGGAYIYTLTVESAVGGDTKVAHQKMLLVR